MSISVDTYRLRIGIFTNKPRLKTKVQGKLREKVKMSKKKLMTINVVKVLMLLILVQSLKSEVQQSSVTLLSKLLSFTECPTNCPIISQYIIDHNFLARYTFGNRRNSGIKMCHWNAGSSYLINKINEIEAVISNYKPHIIGFSEVCYSAVHSVDQTKIDDYKVYFAKTLDNPSLEVSRVTVYVHNDVQSKLGWTLCQKSLVLFGLRLDIEIRRKF